MLFEKKENLNILICPSCKGYGLHGFSTCKMCNGHSVGFFQRNQWLSWSYPLNRYNLALFSAKKLWNKIRKITLVVLWLNSWLWSFFLIYRAGLINELFFSPYNLLWLSDYPNIKMAIFLFWLGLFILLFFWYRIVVEKKKYGQVEKFNYSKKFEDIGDLFVNEWEDIKKIKNSHKININYSFTSEAIFALAEAYKFADKINCAQFKLDHLFYALLSFAPVSNVFIRLGVPSSTLRNSLGNLLKETSIIQTNESMPAVSIDVWQAIFDAYEEAYLAHQNFVGVPELLSACINHSEILKELLYNMDVDGDKLNNVIKWERIKERLYRQYSEQKRIGSHRSKYGMDKAMTAVATPYLNRFSEDMTRLAQLSVYDFCVARDKETEEMFRIVEGGSASIILTGAHGVGKRSIVEGLAQRMVAEDVPIRLQDKRLVRLNVAELLSGINPAGAIQRLIMIMNEIARARNVILFIHNIHELVGVSAGEGSSLDVAGTLADYLKSGRFLTIATTTVNDYAKYISDSPLSNVFTKIDVDEMDENQAIQVVESKVALYEHKQKVFFSYDAIEQAVKLSSRFLHESYLPGSAIEVVSESAVYTKNTKGINTLVSAEEVAKVISDKTGVPVTTVTMDESNKLLKLEQEMHLRVIGQDEAVDLIASALRRARVEIRSKNRPIANFLFLGPTGVGKTELAKTIAEIYFGGEDRMIRLDMSEYQDKTSIYRLIGSLNEKGTGILTEAVRRQPFALLLLDEIEKADPDILNLFLQVMDDGRLTDSVGRVVDFTNIIIIATSNAGTGYVQEQMRSGVASEIIKEHLLHGELKSYFRPEFLNRFDGIVLFKALTMDNIKQIAKLMLNRVISDLEHKSIQLIVDDEALDYLASIGYDPEFGARPMRRVLQERVENKLAEMILSGEIKRRDRVVLGSGSSLTVLH